jgi:hypothetical protein
MRKYLILAGLLLLPVFAQAHEVKRSGTLEILSHREPEDSPIAREPAILYFSVTDSNDRFTFSDCDCFVSVSEGGDALLDRKLTAEDEAPDWGVNVSKVDYVFPELGVYVLNIQGKSKTGSFNDFSLDYDVRIERESATVPAGSANADGSSFLKNYYIIGGALIILGIIIYETINKSRNKRK